jgi:translocation and assembly module TamB
VKIELPFKVDQIIWQGPPEAVVQDLRGRYEYTGTDHELKVSSLRFAQGAYQAQLKLQGAAPMALQAEATGDVQVPNPLDKSDDALNTIAVQARVTAEGTLATEAARLEIKANASAETSGSGADTQEKQLSTRSSKNGSPQSRSPQQQMGPMQADVEASIMPWRSQPLLAAKARLRNLDVSAFWPQGPRTLLTGQLQAGPDETVAPATNLEAQPWNLNTSFSNALPGPWDRQRLPVAELTARIHFDGQQWQVDDSRIQIGKGHIALGGQFTPSTRLFEGLATVEQLNPADLYSTLEAAPWKAKSAPRLCKPSRQRRCRCQQDCVCRQSAGGGRQARQQGAAHSDTGCQRPVAGSAAAAGKAAAGSPAGQRRCQVRGVQYRNPAGQGSTQGYGTRCAAEH